MGDSDFKNEDSISTEHRQDASYIDLVEAFKVSEVETDDLLSGPASTVGPP